LDQVRSHWQVLCQLRLLLRAGLQVGHGRATYGWCRDDARTCVRTPAGRVVGERSRSAPTQHCCSGKRQLHSGPAVSIAALHCKPAIARGLLTKPGPHMSPVASRAAAGARDAHVTTAPAASPHVPTRTVPNIRDLSEAVPGAIQPGEYTARTSVGVCACVNSSARDSAFPMFRQPFCRPRDQVCQPRKGV
jgi:hypothetical protein